MYIEVQKVIRKVTAEGKLFTHRFDLESIPKLPSQADNDTEIQPLSKKRKSRWDGGENNPEEAMVSSRNASKLNSAAATAATAAAMITPMTSAVSSNAKAAVSTTSTNINMKNTSLQMNSAIAAAAAAAASIAQATKQTLLGVNKSNEKEMSKSKDKKKSHAVDKVEDEEERKKLMRLQRFQTQQTPKQEASSGKKNKGIKEKKRRLRDEQEESGEGTWDGMPKMAVKIVGTSEEVEKDYFRLTSSPDPTTIRPERVLQKALKMLKWKWQNKEVDYTYMNSQLKAVRQDMVVQGIQSSKNMKKKNEEDDDIVYCLCQSLVALGWMHAC